MGLNEALPTAPSNPKGLENTSDGINHCDGEPAVIDSESLDRLTLFRQEGILPHPYQIISNTHQEFSAQVIPDNPSVPSINSATLAKKLEKLHLPDGTPAQSEPPLETLDFYTLNPTHQYTQRLRFYFNPSDNRQIIGNPSDNRIVSARIILADFTDNQKAAWQHNGFVVAVRPEHIALIRQDAQNGHDIALANLALFTQIIQNSPISHIIFKRTWKLNFGPDRRWTHRLATDKQGQNLTNNPNLNIIGMGPYLTPCLQEICQATLSSPLSPDQLNQNLSLLLDIQPPLSPSNILQILINHYPHQSSSARKLEIEAKGEENKTDAAFLVEQLHNLLPQHNLSLVQSNHRKVNFYN